MRILVGWDDAEEATLISLYLNVEENSAEILTDPAKLVAAAKGDTTYDVILLCTCLPDFESAYEIFVTLQRYQPDAPVVAACHSEDVFRMAKFLTHGMRTYLLRDANKDFHFLLEATLSNTVDAVKAERERIVSEKLREEIESVRKLQESIIPDDIQAPDGYEVVARYEPSQIRVLGGQPVTLAGGDYYDAFCMVDDSLVLLIGDASGHGMKACMSIMTMHTLVSMIRTNRFKDTASFVADVNRRLCEQSIVQDEGGFITLLYGILTPSTSTFEWTSAGHPVPLLQDLTTKKVTPMGTIDDGGLPLGIYEEAEYDTHSSPIPPNSRLAIFTDGIEEAFPDAERMHEQYGIDGIIQTLVNTGDKTLQEALQALFDDSNAFTQGTGRHDDTSVMLVERK